MYTQTMPRDNIQTRRYKRGKPALHNATKVANKTLERHQSFKQNKDSDDDSLDRASEQTIKMSETVKLGAQKGTTQGQKYSQEINNSIKSNE